MATNDVGTEVTVLTSADELSTNAESGKFTPLLEQTVVTVETTRERLNETLGTAEDRVASPSSAGKKSDRRESYVYKDSATNVSYEVQPGSSKRGRDKLIDSLGFTYNCKPIKSTKTVTWTCSVRNARLRCPATVLQRGEVFLRGTKKHKHFLGQILPKAGSEGRQFMDTKSRVERSKRNDKTGFKGNQDYRIIKNGSKAGMDLLRDCLGYTYTYKRCTVGGYKTFWICSVRNKHLHCDATVIQYDNGKFVEGPHDHKHLPAFNIPARPGEVIPSLRKIREEREDDDSDFEQEAEPTDKTEQDGNEDRYSTNQSGSTYLHSGKNSVAAAKRKANPVMKEKKRREHDTFLGPQCTINLSKCEDIECNCQLVHCPFCDPEHFKPTRAGRVQDHLELTHFAHGVQYDDLMIVKCFKECDVDRIFGHYHCVFCSQQIIKRDFYARHMLRHLRTMGIPERLLMLPDSKYPDVINAYGYEIPICKNGIDCTPTGEDHYHCPCCSKVCLQRSLTVNHLWRCFQKQQGATEDISDGDETQICNTVDEEQIVLHFSHVKSVQDLPVEKSRDGDGYMEMYRCPMCPEDIFIPSYKQQLLVHYLSHWKNRVMYKNYAVLRCYHICQTDLRAPSKSKYHYHCPICTKTIQSKITFEEHLKSCHLLRFGENLICAVNNLDESVDDTIASIEDPVPLQESVEFLEDQLIAQSKAYTHKKTMERKKMKREQLDEKSQSSTPSMYRKPVKRGTRKSKLTSSSSKKGDNSDDESEEEIADTPGVIDETEIFEYCTAVLSQKCMQTIWSRDDLQSVLGEVAGKTEINLSLNDDGNYHLTGPVSNLHHAQFLLTQSINKESPVRNDKRAKNETPLKEMKNTPVIKKATIKRPMLKKPISKKPILKKPTQKKTLRAPTRLTEKAGTGNKPIRALAKKLITAATNKRGRGRPRKEVADQETFPYSEIKEIIKACKSKDTNDSVQQQNSMAGKSPSQASEKDKKNTDEELPKTPNTVKRGRGRPPKYPKENKDSPAANVDEENQNTGTPRSKTVQKKPTATTPSTPEIETTLMTPRRYGTRGLRKDYAGMNAGSGIFEIKLEPLDSQENPYERNSRSQSTGNTPSKKRKRNNVEESDEPLPQGKKRKPSDTDLNDEEEELKDMDEDSDERSAETENTTEVDNAPDLIDDSVEEIVLQNDEDHSTKRTSSEEQQKEKHALEQTMKQTSAKKQTSSVYVKKDSLGGKVYVPLMSIVKKTEDSSSQAEKTKFQCSYCDKTFAYKSNLDDHENKHTGATPYNCEVCTKAFPSQSMLMKHKTLVHTTVRPYKCTVCHKSFRFMNVLQSHVATHMKPRQHVCTLCNKSYSTASTLKFHQQRCTGIRDRDNVTVVSDKNIIICTDVVPSPRLQQTVTQYTVTEQQVEESTLIDDVKTEYDMKAEPDIAEEEPVYAESNGEAEDTAGQEESVGEVELYACSECNNAFDSYAKAEAHILTVHSVA